MKYLQFSDINKLGVMFDMFSEITYIIFVIEVDGKEYTGTVNTLCIKDGGNTIISGKFHPYLEKNIFPAFDIYPDQFTVKKMIDLKAPENSQTLDVLLCTDYILGLAGKQNKDGLIKTMPEIIRVLKNAVNEFTLTHPEINPDKPIFLLNETLEKLNELKNGEIELTETINYIKNNVMDALRALFFKQQ
jgi:hypothetical protein